MVCAEIDSVDKEYCHACHSLTVFSAHFGLCISNHLLRQRFAGKRVPLFGGML